MSEIVGDAGDRDGGKVERLGVDQAVGGNGEEFAEGGEVYVGEGERGLLVVETGAGVIVVVGENVLGMRLGVAKMKGEVSRSAGKTLRELRTAKRGTTWCGPPRVGWNPRGE